MQGLYRGFSTKGVLRVLGMHGVSMGIPTTDSIRYFLAKSAYLNARCRIPWYIGKDVRGEEVEELSAGCGFQSSSSDWGIAIARLLDLHTGQPNFQKCFTVCSCKVWMIFWIFDFGV